MKFVKYILKKFIPVFLGAVGFFTLILELVDLLMRIWEYMSQHVPLATIFYIMFLYMPKCISFAVPLSVLFATSYIISDFYAKNELTSIFASGVSLFRFTLPLLILALIMSFGLFFFENYVVVPTYAKKTSLQDEALKKQKSMNNDKIIVLSEGGNVIYKADYYDDKNQRLYGIFIVKRDEEKKLRSVLRSDSAFYRDEQWSFVNSTSYTFNSDGTVDIEADSEGFEITEPPETFRNNVVDVDTVDVAAARQYIDHLQRTGLPYAEPLSVYYKKFAFPFIVFIVVFLSIGLSGKTRKNVLLISLVLSLAGGTLFYVTQMVTMLLAKFGFITPFMGAWFPVFLFVVLSSIVMYFART